MSEQRTITVKGGAYATVRAIEKAQQQYGCKVTVTGITDIRRSEFGTEWYTYRVEDRKTP